jgi:carboxymethylenebutenolidase
MDFVEKELDGLTRRDFIKGTAAGAVGMMATGAAGAVLAASQPETQPSQPAKGMPSEAMCAELVNMRGHEGDTISAYLARPTGPGPYPGVVVVHHIYGLDEATKEIARRFAHNGYAAISPDLNFREGKGTMEANAASVSAAGGMPDNRTMGDVEGAIRYLRTLPYLNGKVGIIGYCSGGRQVYLAACTLKGIDAAIACYPGGVAAGPAGLTPRQPADPFDYTKDLSCPLLGFFGKEDKRPSPEHMAKIEAELKKWGKTYEFNAYDNAGHAFFAVDRASYRPEAAVDGWKKVFQWFAKYLR